MTIAADPSEVSFAGDGTSLTFTVPFPFGPGSDLKVTSTDSVGSPTVLATGFSVSGGNGNNGSITFLTAPAADVTITIQDDPPATQPAEYTDNDAFPAEAHEGALDRTVRLVKRLKQQLLHTIRTSDGDPISADDLLLAPVNTRKGKYLYFDAITGALDYVVGVVTTTISQSIIAQLLNPQTAAEAGAGVTIANYLYKPGRVNRYAINTTPGSTDMRPAILAAIAQGQSSAAGSVKRIIFEAQRYKVSATIQIDWGGVSLSFVGERGDYSVDTGTQIEFSGSSACIFMNGASTWEGYKFSGLKFKAISPSAAVFALRVRDSWFLAVDDCIIEDFNYVPGSGTVSSGIRFENLCLCPTISNTKFTNNAIGVQALGSATMNAFTFDNNAFFGSTLHAILGGDYYTTGTFGFTTWVLRNKQYEGCIGIDVLLKGSVNNLLVDGGYAEWTGKRPFLKNLNPGLSTAAKVNSLSLQGEVDAGEGFIEMDAVDGLKIDSVVTTLNDSLTDGVLVSLSAIPKNFSIARAAVPTGTAVPTLLLDGVSYSAALVDDNSIACQPGIANLESADGPSFTLTPGIDPVHQLCYQPISVTNNVTLNDPPLGLGSAARFVFRRTAAATGAFDLNIKSQGGTLIVAISAASRWAEVVWTGGGGGGWSVMMAGNV